MNGLALRTVRLSSGFKPQEPRPGRAPHASSGDPGEPGPGDVCFGQAEKENLAIA